MFEMADVGAMGRSLRTGDWLTEARLHAWPAIMLAVAAAIAVVWVALSDRLIDRNGRPIGTDFTNVYAAGALALEGSAAAAYDPVQQHAAEKAIFEGREVPFYGWHYPPLFLMIAAALALLPYGAALSVWMAATFALYLAVVRAIVERREALLAAAAFPAVLVNLGHGQNGFLTAALLGGALLSLDRRPALAGVLFGLLAYKPHFGLLIPLVLAATGRWQQFAAAGATVIAAAAATLLLFGAQTWLAFLDSTAFTQAVVLESGGTGWQKIQSLFSFVRMWGGSVEFAYAAQSALALAVAGALVWLWRGAASDALKAAGLACGCLLVSPYVLDYDLVLLGVAIAFQVRHGLARGFRDYEITLLAAAWVAPLVARSLAGATGAPIGLMAVLAVLALSLRRAALDQGLIAGRDSLVKA